MSAPFPQEPRVPEEPQARAQDPGAPGAQQPQAPAPTIWEQMGGPMGMVDSGLPVVVFIVVNSLASLGPALVAALAAGVLIAALRVARRRPVSQAIAGLFGVGIAAFIANRTGEAKGFFLLGIWQSLIYAGAFGISILLRWPLVGLIWEGINGRGRAWRTDRRLLRRYSWATAVWVVVFAARYAVQNWLYETDQVGWLAAVRIGMGYPVFLIGLAASVLIVLGGPAGVAAIRSARRGSRGAPQSTVGPVAQPAERDGAPRLPDPTP